jgi:hypothetical protein
MDHIGTSTVDSDGALAQLDSRTLTPFLERSLVGAEQSVAG